VRILALGAHPDDIEYGCGGTLLAAVARKHEVFLGVMTDGSATTKANRVAEQEKAAKYLGATDLVWGGFTDTRLEHSRELITAIEQLLRKTSPDMVFVNAPTDAHQDHQALASCAVTACRYIKRVLFYHDYTSIDFLPDTYCDIGETLQAKRKLLACHKSQVSKQYPTGLDMLESVSALAAYYGFMAKVKYAEAFKPLRNLINIYK
jgi:LmbE family N-acetylglucosaminyl deacetylase